METVRIEDFRAQDQHIDWFTSISGALEFLGALWRRYSGEPREGGASHALDAFRGLLLDRSLGFCTGAGGADTESMSPHLGSSIDLFLHEV